MNPVYFEGSREIKKPPSLTDEECMSVWAMPVETKHGRMWVEAWQPNREDIEAINRGEPVWIQIHSMGLPPIGVFTMNENGESNDAG